MKLKVTTKFGCDFCGKSEDEVAALVTGPGDIAICDTCAGIAATHPKSQISSALVDTAAAKVEGVELVADETPALILAELRGLRSDIVKLCRAVHSS